MRWIKRSWNDLKLISWCYCFIVRNFTTDLYRKVLNKPELKNKREIRNDIIRQRIINYEIDLMLKKLD